MSFDPLEQDCSGALSAPLIVPFLHGAIQAIDDGARPGTRDTLPSIREVDAAHRAVLDVYGSASTTAPRMRA